MDADREARRAFILSRCATRQRGLEINPYHQPITDRTTHDVVYVDDRQNDDVAWQEWAREAAAGDRPPAVDAVWVPGVRLCDCLDHQPLFYAVASHVMEHAPDPLGWLRNILDVLEPGGVIALMLPHRDRTMDARRQLTTFAEVVGWSLEKPVRPTPAQVMDFLTHALAADGVSRHYNDAEAITFARRVADEGLHLDIHCTTWTPDSFRDVITRLVCNGLLDVDVDGPHDSFPGSLGDEFAVFLRRTA